MPDQFTDVTTTGYGGRLVLGGGGLAGATVIAGHITVLTRIS